MSRLILILLFTALGLFGQSYPKTATKLQSGTTVPSSCTAGQVFVKTNGTATQQLYICNVSNSTFALQGSSSSSVYAIYVGSPQGPIGGATALFNPLTGAASTIGVEANVTTAAPATATFSNLCVTTRGAQPATGTTTIMLRKALANTALTFTILANAAAGVYCDNTHTVSVTVGDLLDIQGINNTSFTSAIINSTSVIQQ